ncbi:hypothetical protein F4692_003137 [Nocardioides cavernae]|uniref:Uncharacterized protein n=1 Tax=Nocardioides cavernae TaxID=1921566 RepID=A0A7Y9KTV9_9ACTN|nr:hypothetical protein [Nocardioides cavernae]NYE37992.1 hypothetical protein [Nocardioides cavernae]
MPRHARPWERLLTLLGTVGEVDASTPGRIRVRIGRQRVEVVMTEREWEDLVRVPYGSFDGAAQHLLRALALAQADQAPYLVHHLYDLEPSQTPQSPSRLLEETDLRAARESLREHPGTPGEWRPYPPGHEKSQRRLQDPPS